MKTIKQILFPTDFSDTAGNAFRFALWFADHYGAEIRVLHVVYPESTTSDFPTVAGQATQDRADVALIAMNTFVDLGLTQVQAGYQLQQVPVVKPDVQIGTPSTVIAREAERLAADLIIMGTQGEHTMVEKVLGSVSANTIRKAGCAVLAVPADARWDRIDTVACATVLGESDPWHLWETTRLLEPFRPLVRIVHIARDQEEETPVQMEELQAFFGDRSPALQTTYHTLYASDIQEEMTDFAETNDVDLLVMYRPKRSLFERIFHTSVTRKTALYASIPVLILPEE